MQKLVFYIFLIVATFGWNAIGEADTERFLLITGCARSGTTYIAKVLTAAGLDIGHECYGEDGISSWPMAVTAEKTPWGPARNSNVHFKHIFHQVRHPLKNISSHLSEPPESWEYIYSHVPEINRNDPFVVKSAKYWYYWNLHAESIADFTYQVENLYHVWNKMQKKLGIYLNGNALSVIPQNTNTRGAHIQEVTWEYLQRELDPVLYRDIRKLSKHYGYSLKEE